MEDGYVLNAELLQAVRQVVLQHMSSFQPRPQAGRRQRPRKGGTTAPPDLTSAGGFAMAEATIPEPTEVAFSALPEEVQDAAGDVDPDAECFVLGKAGGKDYRLFYHDGDAYIVPKSGSVTLFNSAGLVAPGVPLQIKLLKVGETTIRVVDVEKCS